ncbi:hypothetical protein BSL78_20201 [Apostichopus japonicus]|uniref:Ig-like domain-containing protein n=1 Tax=Stichopus japonicus TaxID=307972 RepID=A0A2G8K4S0_STIJA|nr:hypothetical protein BSL78_20201 [Apostichopus japonicus]
MGTKATHCMVDGNIQGYYWYKGSTSSTQPILRLENGVKGGEKYDDDHYDITSDGNMKIINAMLEHEATYTFAVFFENGTTWSRSISVVISVTPRPPCPLVQSCRNCDECIIRVKSNDPTSLTCYIEQVRPNVTLYWTVKGDNVTYTETASSAIKTHATDTWEISTTILFALACAEDAIFYCSAHYNEEIFTIGNKTLQIRSGNCNEDNLEQTGSSTKVLLICVLTASGILIIGLAACYKLKRRHREWQDDCCGDNQYVITSADLDETDVTNTDDLLEALSEGEQGNRVLFVGEPGIGKSHLFRDISRKWKNGKILKDFILIYIQLDNVPKGSCILELLRRKISTDKEQSKLDNLENEESIVMLDGVSNWSRLGSTASNTENEKKLTVEQLLMGDIGQFSKMKLWVTSRNRENDIKRMQEPYTTVNVRGFTETQRNLFFEKLWQQKQSEINENEKESGKLLGKLLGKRKQESRALDNNPEEIPLNTNFVDISDAWQTHMDKISHDNDYISRSPLIACLFASMYLNTNNERNSIEEECLFGFFREIGDTTKNLLKSGNCDLLACLLEVGTNGEEEYQKYVKTFQLENLIFKHITDEYYQEAIQHLLKSCGETDTVFQSLEIYGGLPVVKLGNLPKIKDRLVFHGFHLAENDDFISVMRTVSQKTKTIEFHDSKVPERLPEDELQDIDNFHDEIKVLRTNGGITFERLCKDGEWKEIITANSEVQN